MFDAKAPQARILHRLHQNLTGRLALHASIFLNGNHDDFFAATHRDPLGAF
jgi:hypothetical protein